MIQRIATGDSGEPVVLAELNEHEKASLASILRLAEQHMDKIQFPRLRSRRQMAEAMLSELRSVYGIEQNDTD